jgi:adenylylsulfate kinase
MITWLTGQPGSGKTTISNILLKHYKEKTNNVITIDGDNLRKMTNNYDYTIDGRFKNITNAQMIARFLHHNDFIVIVSLVTPYLELRESFKNELQDELIEIYVHCDSPRRGNQVEEYEPPKINFINVNTTNSTIEQTVKYIIDKIDDNNLKIRGKIND